MNDCVPYPKECCDSNQPSIMARLAMRKQSLEIEMQQVGEALAAIEKNPDVERTLTALSKVLGSRIC